MSAAVGGRGGGDPGQAVEAWRGRVATAPEDPTAWLELGVALARTNEHGAALEAFERAAALRPADARPISNAAHMLNLLQRPEEAAAAAERALALDGALQFAWKALATARLSAGRLEEAEAASRRALALVGPDGAGLARSEALSDLGVILGQQGRRDEALAVFAAALAQAPDPSAPGALRTRYRRSHVRLALGDYAGGFDDYEARWRSGVFDLAGRGLVTPALEARLTLRPTAADLAGRRVLAVAEQGIGDEVMFAGLLPELAAMAAEVACVVDPRLVALAARSFPGVAVSAGPAPGDLAARYETVVALGSLAYAFRREAASFSGAPYLTPDPAALARWRGWLGPAGGRRRIGVSWRGGLARTRRGARSMPLETLRPLLSRADLEIVDLQYGDAADEVAAVNATLARAIRRPPPGATDDFEELAALVLALDGVVTVQTALAHVTGAVGQRGLVMLPRHPEWRYGAAGERMPWYRSLRLFRQADDGDWAAVVAAVSDAL
jgi:tetratricopeptide (TPR) repeat protein